MPLYPSKMTDLQGFLEIGLGSGDKLSMDYEVFKAFLLSQISAWLNHLAYDERIISLCHKKLPYYR